MKNNLTTRTHRMLGILMLAGALVTAGCGSKKEPAGDAAPGSTAGHHDDAGAPPHTHDSTGASIPAAPAASDVKTYVFHGTPTKIDASAGTITIDHEKIDDFMEAMTTTIKVADPAILASAKVGKETHFTLRVAGSDMLVTKVQDEHESETAHAGGSHETSGK